MTIYCQEGAPVQITSARNVPVWIARGRGECKWHFTEPKAQPGITVTFAEVLHVRAMIIGPYRDGTSEIGAPLFDGQEFPASRLVADRGFKEIDAACEPLLKDAAA